MPKRSEETMTPEWLAYWSDPKAPHPDSFAYKKASKPLGRVLAPFSGKAGSPMLKDMDGRESFYCHHYRLPHEHWHKSMAELEQCRR